MNDDIALGYPALTDVLVHLGLPAVARQRIAEIDRALSEELDDDAMDIERCASLILEAAELVADVDLATFDWSGWGENDPGEDDDSNSGHRNRRHENGTDPAPCPLSNALLRPLSVF